MTTPLARHRARRLTTANAVTLTTTVPPSTQTAASPLAHCDRQRLQPDQQGDLGRMKSPRSLDNQTNPAFHPSDATRSSET